MCFPGFGEVRSISYHVNATANLLNRLGNNDVTKDVAQGVSCLNMPDFESALSTIRGALAGHLGQKRGLEDSYQALCDSYGLNEDALSWMEMVDKELHKSGELKSLEVDEESVMYMVFYWTCTALNVSSSGTLYLRNSHNSQFIML